MFVSLNASRPSAMRMAWLGVLILAGLWPAAGQNVVLPNGKAPKMVCLIAEGEYHAKEEVPKFTAGLQSRYGIQVVNLINPTPGMKGFGPERHTIPNMVELEDADLVYIQVRRRGLPKEQMRMLRKFLARGGALMGARTASHAFAPQEPKPEDELEPATLKLFQSLDQWRSLDREVLGCTYRGHYGSQSGETEVRVVPGMEGHPILKGVPEGGFRTVGSLYKSRPLGQECQVLLTGTNLDGNVEPVAWTNRYGKSRVFYTSLGHWEDWGLPGFHRMMTNAVFWSLGMDVPR